MKKFNPDKELYKIQHGNRNKIYIGIIILLLIISIGSTYALYQVRYTKRIIYTKVAPFSNKDIELAVFLDGEPQSDVPERGTAYYAGIDCENDENATANWDYSAWKISDFKVSIPNKCDVYFTKAYKDVSGANVPELYQGLIPVTFGSNGQVIVADPSSNWYDYNDHRWANAVLVNNTKYNDLVYNGLLKKEKYGTEISMSDILQMYVWIPRYKYQLFNSQNGTSSNPQMIRIEFENGTETTGTVKCIIAINGKETCENDANGNWYTHPAFSFGDSLNKEENTQLTGFWVGKFETSHSSKSLGNGNYDSNAVLGCIDNNCIEADNLRIIPSVSSLRYNNISNFFFASQSLTRNINPFNLNRSLVDTHMMKNMEWGAMAYLTHSQYGRCEANGTCEEVTINGNSSYLTGYANTSDVWNSEKGQKASTTGNIYGIYDTNGGAREHVMGVVVKDTAGSDIIYDDSGFNANTMPKQKYYDLYEYGTAETIHGRGHLGDATRETVQIFGNAIGGWYSGYTGFPFNLDSWFERGGYHVSGVNADTFSFYRSHGTIYYSHSFRVVLTALDNIN